MRLLACFKSILLFYQYGNGFFFSVPECFTQTFKGGDNHHEKSPVRSYKEAKVHSGSSERVVIILYSVLRSNVKCQETQYKMFETEP